MKSIRSITQMSGLSRNLRLKAERIGLVPTMGALHDGHLSLIRRARQENDCVVVSIFVNPAQFGPTEDFRKYSRNLRQDSLLCKEEGVDVIFHPPAKGMYPGNYKTYVKVSGLSDVLCGKSRPGHFQGVVTVVTKLFNIIQPDTAYFGRKDAQQAIIIQKMVSDLNMPCKIKVMPTVREPDGLAMSSRNAYLNPKERKDAVVLQQALHLAQDLIRKGIRDAQTVIRSMRKFIQNKKAVRVDYVSIVDLENLKPVKGISGPCLIAIAVWIGKTRLIDNVWVTC